jgi:hypothetical protein
MSRPLRHSEPEAKLPGEAAPHGKPRLMRASASRGESSAPPQNDEAGWVVDGVGGMRREEMESWSKQGIRRVRRARS